MSVYPTLKLTYFNIKARAEPIRLALAINDIPFEDERIPRDQWATLKPTTPFGQVPLLTVNGSTVIAQSTAILRYVGKFGPLKLYPDDALKAALVDQLISQVQDVEASLRPSGAENDPVKKLALRVELAEKGLPPLFAALDAFIAKYGGAYATGSDITIADLFVYQMNTSYSAGAYDGIPATILAGYEHIQKVVKAVKSHPAVSKWEAAH
ncbi:thioredoxin-like protein [Rhizoclosmatium globosum]|uniref:Thioredoxin-like protein n=1 Tax=Rhizoclosmatium globosum TaxID=329046 RepID=A0A1Y2D275_9FUNG|nr:hypothetical protein HDU79_007023 [Rhizoclosmatium sp. JEL0117]ORY53224.1 thioredoxin-like protein [Rhizoclosmatium globosum]|eukprot:ORY53224.1 thioredoxin-like protein [Rhizoclosmatium globosum]